MHAYVVPPPNSFLPNVYSKYPSPFMQSSPLPKGLALLISSVELTPPLSHNMLWIPPKGNAVTPCTTNLFKRVFSRTLWMSMARLPAVPASKSTLTTGLSTPQGGLNGRWLVMLDVTNNTC